MVRPSDSVRLCGDGAGRASLLGARRRPFVVRRPYFRRAERHDRFVGGEKLPGKVTFASCAGAYRPGERRPVGGPRKTVAERRRPPVVVSRSTRGARVAGGGGGGGVAPGVGGETAGNLSDPS